MSTPRNDPSADPAADRPAAPGAAAAEDAARTPSQPPVQMAPPLPRRLRPETLARTLCGALAAFLLGLNCIFCVGVLLFPVALVKLITPARSRIRDLCDRILHAVAKLWIDNNGRWQRLTQDLTLDVDGVQTLRRSGWYLVTCNHQSWVDVVLLQRVLSGRIPLLKFFLKRELIYVPFMGFAWWALDFPFMYRHSKEFLARHPEQRGKDLLVTRKACARFSRVPTSVFNFLEGSRVTAAKHAQQASPYRYLLRPKAAGLALAVQALGDKFSSLLSLTIIYPDGVPTFWEFLCNRVPRIQVRAREVQIPQSLMRGDYEGDADYRRRFQDFVNTHWAEKDEEIHALRAAL